MKPVWYVQQQERDPDQNIQRLISTIQEQDMRVTVEKYIPFGGMSYEFLPTDWPVIAHGTIGMLKNIQRVGHNGEHFYPAAWCDWEKLRCRTYYTHWGEHLLQRYYGFYTLAEINRLSGRLYTNFSNYMNQIFIRPDENNKEFNGEVVHFDRFDSWYDITCANQPPPETLCVVAMPESISAEFRLIVADGKVVAGSMYRKDNQIEYKRGYPDEAKDFAEMVSAIWSPHPIFCLDVASMTYGYKVIECGSVNAAGFYESDLRPIVEAMARIAEREWKDEYSG